MEPTATEGYKTTDNAIARTLSVPVLCGIFTLLRGKAYATRQIR